MNEQKSNPTITPIRENILKTLAYYDIFTYPLTKKEIYYCTYTNGSTETELYNELEKLVKERIVFRKDDYYFINNNSSIVSRRIKGNLLATKKMKLARFFSKVIAHFPYVRGVLLSGSISKGFMEEDADIDYFIITAKNRLWIARLFLVAFKKLFLLNSYKFFCINYFITEDNLEIEEKNIYTAIEFATLIPTYGADLYEKLYGSNNWIKKYVPNYPKRDVKTVKPSKRKTFQVIVESIFNNKFGDILDDKIMQMFFNFDKKRYGNIEESTFSLAFKTRKNVSKHHPNFFQKRVLDALHNKLSQLKTKYKIAFSESEI